MNIAICDDNKDTVTMLYSLIKNYFADYDLSLNTISLYTNGNTLLSEMEHGKELEVIFLDIEMPSLSGMEVAKQIREMNSDALIIFITSYPDFMSASFKVEAFDFLTKPLKISEFNATLERCIKKYTQRHSQIAMKTSLGTAVVYLNNIIYVNSNKHYVTLISKDGNHISAKMTLNEIENILKPYQQFVRCHQSYIINLDYILEVQRDKVLLKGHSLELDSDLPVSRKYAAITKEKFLFHHLRLERTSL